MNTLTPLSPADAAAMIDGGHALLIDVREADEFAARHVPGALSRPLSLPDAGPLACGTGSSLIFTCLSGKRTQMNAARLAGLSPGPAYLLEGGVQAWGKAGLPLAGREAAQPLPLMRQVQIAAGALVLLGVALSLLVDPAFIGLAAFVGAGLAFAGLSGWCGMARLLAIMPWNRTAA